MPQIVDTILSLMEEDSDYWKKNEPTNEEAYRWALNRGIITVRDYYELSGIWEAEKKLE